jgi:hypothetical protein
VKFRTLVELGGKTATGLRVPPEVVAALGSGRKPAVMVTVGGYTYRSTVASRGGAFMIPLSAEHRGAAGLAAGDEVDVEVEVDTEPRELVIPEDLRAAVDTDPAARSFFDELSYSNRRRIVGNVEGAKTPQTRQRRIDKAVTQLREGRI